MLSEAVHSGIDGVNDLLPLFGLKRSKRPADEHAPVWVGEGTPLLVVGRGLLGAGDRRWVKVAEGIHSLLKPEQIRSAQTMPGPETVLVTICAEFDPAANADDLMRAAGCDANRDPGALSGG